MARYFLVVSRLRWPCSNGTRGLGWALHGLALIPASRNNCFGFLHNVCLAPWDTCQSPDDLQGWNTFTAVAGQRSYRCRLRVISSALSKAISSCGHPRAVESMSRRTDPFHPVRGYGVSSQAGLASNYLNLSGEALCGDEFGVQYSFGGVAEFAITSWSEWDADQRARHQPQPQATPLGSWRDLATCLPDKRGHVAVVPRSSSG